MASIQVGLSHIRGLLPFTRSQIGDEEPIHIDPLQNIVSYVLNHDNRGILDGNSRKFGHRRWLQKG